MAREFDLDHLFCYHSPTLADGSTDMKKVTAYTAIREKAKEMAETILANTPASADQSDAMRKLRECVMTANASVALDGRLHKFES